MRTATSVVLMVWTTVLLVLCFLNAPVRGGQLIGAGTPAVSEVLDLWSSAFRYTRDDVSMTYQPMASEPATEKYVRGQVVRSALTSSPPPPQPFIFLPFSTTGEGRSCSLLSR
jgi:hypothetical protein